MRARIPLRFAIGLIAFLAATAPFAAAGAGSAAALRESYAVQAKAGTSQFGVPLYLRSQQSANSLQGDVHASIEQPFDKVRTALADPKSWCDILILHPNVKRCRLDASGRGASPSLAVNLGRNELPIEFSYRATAAAADYLDVQLHAPEGPFGTTDYRIALEAAPLDAQHTILHLRYSHDYGMRAKLAMQTYFNTLARGKVGFTVTGKDADGKPQYVRDLRAGLERNAMRYYASIESYLDALAAPADEQLERRLRHWYAYTERYPLQLEEDPGYLDLKRKEAQRTQSEK